MGKVFVKFMNSIKEKNLVNEKDTVILGVSGGPDSVCMLHMFYRYVERKDISLIVAHINHGLRGEESDNDEKIVRRLAETAGFDIRCFYPDVKGAASERGETIEEAARAERYKAFFSLQEELKETKKTPVKIAVAHNLNDQAETVLQRIIRGTGPDGLSGMEYMREDGLIRPLLGIYREEIEQYVEDYGLDSCKDVTNDETRYTRNRIRNKLIPFLEEEFNPSIIDSLARLAENAAEDRECFSETAEKEKWISSRRKYRKIHPAIAKRAIVATFKEMGLMQDINAGQLNSADKMLRSTKSGGTIEFPHGYRIFANADKITFVTKATED